MFMRAMQSHRSAHSPSLPVIIDRPYVLSVWCSYRATSAVVWQGLLPGAAMLLLLFLPSAVHQLVLFYAMLIRSTHLRPPVTWHPALLLEWIHTWNPRNLICSLQPARLTVTR
jgi:hypothetical protein